MNSITVTKPKPAAIESSSGFVDFILRRLRVTQLQAQLTSNEAQTISVALAGGLIGAEDAIAMLGEAGLDFIVTGASSE